MATKSFMDALHILRRTFAVLAALCAALVVFVVVMLATLWGKPQAIGWGLVSAGILTVQFVYLWWHLEENYDLKTGNLNAMLGLANWLSLIRGVLVACMAGFLVGEPSESGLAWVPGILYLVANIMDFLDGYAARRLDQRTRLGESLDMSQDGIGILVGVLLVWRFGQAPVWFVLVGLARFLFILGGRFLERSGKPHFPLAHRPYRRLLAGSQMIFIGIILLPVYSPTVTRWAATFFMLPFLIGFFLDWLIYSGALSERWQSDWLCRTRWIKPLKDWSAFLVRVFILIVLIKSTISIAAPLFLTPWVWFVIILVGAFLLLGMASRGLGVGIMIVAGYAASHFPARWEAWALLFASMTLFFAGPGRFAAWSPENVFLFQRIGEESQGER